MPSYSLVFHSMLLSKSLDLYVGVRHWWSRKELCFHVQTGILKVTPEILKAWTEGILSSSTM